MKFTFTLFIYLIFSISAFAQNGKAITVKTTFHRETSVSIEINAKPSIVWALLTNASDYTRWNSTINSIGGTIGLGQKIKLKSTLDAKRTFTLKIKTFDADRKLVCGDGQGNRVFTLTKNPNGTVIFSMVERIGGLMFPMYSSMIPSFDKSFEQFAADLKKESENKMGIQ